MRDQTEMDADKGQLMETFAKLPTELTTGRRFVSWQYQTRDGKRTKIPISPHGGHAKVNDPETWGTFQDASSYCEKGGLAGIGIILSKKHIENDLVGIDLDHCLDDKGTLTLEGKEIIKTLNSYSEITPSGHGLRIFVKGKLPAGARRKGNIEIYDDLRYLTLTGNHLEGTPQTVETRQEELILVWGKFVSPPAPFKERPAIASRDISDDKLLWKAMNARNGATFQRLYAGYFSDYPSQSEADMALCSILAFWTGKDAGRIDNLFRQSGLYRAKWDIVHVQGRTYGAETIRKAVAVKTETYHGKQERQTPEHVHADLVTKSGPEKPGNELPAVISASDLIETEPDASDQILEDTFDRGDKIAIIGSSKMRKSFFLLLLLLCTASGRQFLSWTVPKPRKILHIQFEIQAHHYHRRVKRMAQAMRITSADLGDRLQIINARGLDIAGSAGLEKIKGLAMALQPEIISFDPLYKIAVGAENAAEDFKLTLNTFDVLAKETGAAILFVHHDTKGNSGDRDVRDRGAGSNVLGRDYDACITLTPHVSEPDAAVIETLLRNYRPQEPFVALWAEDEDTKGYRFDLANGIAATKKTTANSRTQTRQAFDTYLPAAVKILSEQPLPIAAFLEEFRTKTGLSTVRARAFRDWATAVDGGRLATIEKRSRGTHTKVIGLPDQIDRLRLAEEMKNV